jgi:SSS family solute:Na+ symporter
LRQFEEVELTGYIDQALVVVYMVAMFVTGIIMYKRSRVYDEYFIAGRKFSPFFIVITLAAGISSATMAVATLGFEVGMSGAWFFISLGIGAWILLFTIAGRLRALAQYSLTDIFEMRYGPAARVVIAFIGTLAYTILLSIGFVGGGYVLQSVFDINLVPAMLIIAIPFITYTALGGLWASAVTNIVKFIILVAGIIVLIPAGIHSAGGWKELTGALPSGSLNLFSSDALIIAFGFFWVLTLSMWVAADIYQLVFSTKNVRTAKIGLGLAGLLIVVLGLMAAFIGLSTSISFPDTNPNDAMTTLATTLAPGLRGLVFVALLAGSAIAVVMYQLVAATLLVRGVWPKTRVSMNRIRLLSAGIGVAGLLFAIQGASIESLTLWTFRIMVPATFVPTLAAFHWKRATATGSLASSILGAATSGLWTWLVLPKLSINMQSILEPAFIGVTISLIALVIGSYSSRAQQDDKWQLFRPKMEEISRIKME